MVMASWVGGLVILVVAVLPRAGWPLAGQPPALVGDCFRVHCGAYRHRGVPGVASAGPHRLPDALHMRDHAAHQAHAGHRRGSAGWFAHRKLVQTTAAATQPHRRRRTVVVEAAVAMSVVIVTTVLVALPPASDDLRPTGRASGTGKRWYCCHRYRLDTHRSAAARCSHRAPGRNSSNARRIARRPGSRERSADVQPIRGRHVDQPGDRSSHWQLDAAAGC